MRLRLRAFAVTCDQRHEGARIELEPRAISNVVGSVPSLVWNFDFDGPPGSRLVHLSKIK